MEHGESNHKLCLHTGAVYTFYSLIRVDMGSEGVNGYTSYAPVVGVIRPLGHCVQAAAGPSEYVLMGQMEQTLLVPGTFVANEPAGHIIHDVESTPG